VQSNLIARSWIGENIELRASAITLIDPEHVPFSAIRRIAVSSFFAAMFPAIALQDQTNNV
jgi:hypothetical protein